MYLEVTCGFNIRQTKSTKWRLRTFRPPPDDFLADEAVFLPFERVEDLLAGLQAARFEKLLLMGGLMTFASRRQTSST
eukprot:1184664-Amorphochlora_amoeboformis.AAC.2